MAFSKEEIQEAVRRVVAESDAPEASAEKPEDKPSEAQADTATEQVEAVQEEAAEAATEAPAEPAKAQEAPATQAVQEPPPKPQESPKNAALIAQLEKEAKLREKEIELHKGFEKVKQAEELIELLNKDPLAFLDRANTNLDKLSRAVLEGKAPDPTAKVMTEVERIKAELEKERAERRAEKAAAEEKARNEAAVGTLREIAKGKEEFEYVTTLGLENEAWELMRRHYNEKQEVLPEEVALKMVENQVAGLLEKLTQSQKLKAKFQVPAKTATKVVEKPKTLTNAQSTEVTTRVTSQAEEEIPQDTSGRLKWALERIKTL